ncbi:MAG TPA: hypothetical protein VKB86_05035 [Pyrinomonadaceae bacterium]|nr:hypothetical protein [Pyrinomonadaceae bacterium]
MILPTQSSTTIEAQGSSFAQAPFGLNGAWTKVRAHAAGLKWVFCGKVTLAGANAALMLLLAHLMELKLYGLMVTAIGAQLVLSRVLILGVDSGMIRLRTVPELRMRAQEVVRAGLSVLLRRIALLLLISFVVIPLLWKLAPNLPSLVVISIVLGGIATALSDYGYFYWLARLHYRSAAFVQGGTALARLALTIAAALIFQNYPLAVFLAYPLASLIYGVAQTVALKSGNTERTDRALMRRLLRYSFWQGGADIALLLSMYAGTFILMLAGEPTAAGLFGLGLTLSMGFIVVYQAFGEYLYPRIAHVESLRSLAKFLRNSLAATLAVIVACAPIALAVGSLVPKFLRAELQAAVPVFYIVAASFLLLVIECPLKPACHYLLRPQFLFISTALRVTLMVILGFILAPSMGAMGMADAQLFATALSLIILALLVAASLRSAKRLSGEVVALSETEMSARGEM